MKVSAKYKAFIFDMDGTLINSEPVGPITFVQIAEKYGVSPIMSERASFMQSWKRIGDYTDEKTLLTNFVVDHSLNLDPEHFLKEFFENYLKNLAEAPALSGVSDFLHTAKAKGYKMVIVSASKNSQIQTVLANHEWQEIFDYIVGEEDISKHKPDPEGYLKAIQHLKLPADECIIFEDSKNGVIAARKAGAYVVGIREGNSELIDLSVADEVIDNFIEIIIS